MSNTTAVLDAEPQSMSWSSAAAALVALTCVSVASYAGHGSYHPVGLAALAGALIAVAAAVTGRPRWSALEGQGARSLLRLTVIALCVQLVMILGAQPLNHRSLGQGNLATYNAWIVGLAAIVIGPLLLPASKRRFFLPFLVLLHGALGVWLVRMSPAPTMDVWVQAQRACEAFSRGVNPYTITFPNIYGEIGPLVYPRGVLRDGVVHFGYQYMPLTFFASYASWWLTGDVRYGGLVALELGALFIGLLGREPFGRLSAALLLFLGSVYQVIENGWTEPYVVCCVAAAVYCALRRPKLFPWVLGLLLMSKQHMPLAALAALLVTGFRWHNVWPVAWRAALVGAIVTLPMALWDLGAFYHGVFWVQLNNPFRADSLSFASLYARQVGHPPPRMIELVAAALGAALMLWRAPRTAAGFALGVVAIYLPLFAFGKQAFTNYWFFTVGALATAVSALTASLLAREEEGISSETSSAASAA